MDNKKKVGIATLYTGFNYGSMLQAYALKMTIEELGYKGEIFKIKGSLIKGRDIRLGKLFTVVFRGLFNKGGLKELKNYKNSISKKLSEKIVNEFEKFKNDYIKPTLITNNRLKKIAKQNDFSAFVCGSDQIWNSTSLYVDPFYYLRFAPQKKRIAYAPSFGKDYVPKYNEKKIRKYVGEIKNKSVREQSGQEIIKMLTGETVDVLIDPTLILSAMEWDRLLNCKEDSNEKYLLAYFLDEPSTKAKNMVSEIAEKEGLKVIYLPYETDWFNCAQTPFAGPKQFVELIKNAQFVCTDSFHGTAFSINYNVPFFVFERNYGKAVKQSTRIQSILEKTNLQNRFEPIDGAIMKEISFDSANHFLNEQREKSKAFLKNAISENI